MTATLVPDFCCRSKDFETISKYSFISFSPLNYIGYCCGSRSPPKLALKQIATMTDSALAMVNIWAVNQQIGSLALYHLFFPFSSPSLHFSLLSLLTLCLSLPCFISSFFSLCSFFSISLFYFALSVINGRAFAWPSIM